MKPFLLRLVACLFNGMYMWNLDEGEKVGISVVR